MLRIVVAVMLWMGEFASCGHCTASASPFGHPLPTMVAACPSHFQTRGGIRGPRGLFLPTLAGSILRWRVLNIACHLGTVLSWLSAVVVATGVVKTTVDKTGSLFVDQEVSYV